MQSQNHSLVSSGLILKRGRGEMKGGERETSKSCIHSVSHSGDMIFTHTVDTVYDGVLRLYDGSP